LNLLPLDDSSSSMAAPNPHLIQLQAAVEAKLRAAVQKYSYELQYDAILPKDAVVQLHKNYCKMQHAEESYENRSEAKEFQENVSFSDERCVEPQHSTNDSFAVPEVFEDSESSSSAASSPAAAAVIPVTVTNRTKRRMQRLFISPATANSLNNSNNPSHIKSNKEEDEHENGEATDNLVVNLAEEEFNSIAADIAAESTDSGSPSSSTTLATSSNRSSQEFKEAESRWLCSSCTYTNPMQYLMCEICHFIKPNQIISPRNRPIASIVTNIHEGKQPEQMKSLIDQLKELELSHSELEATEELPNFLTNEQEESEEAEQCSSEEAEDDSDEAEFTTDYQPRARRASDKISPKLQPNKQFVQLSDDYSESEYSNSESESDCDEKVSGSDSDSNSDSDSDGDSGSGREREHDTLFEKEDFGKKVFLTKANRGAYAAELYEEYNRTIFKNRMPRDMTIEWSKKLYKTAGMCYWKGALGSENCHCRIELSIKVLTDLHRLRSTLVHEMCHAACWLIDASNCGHTGPFKRWGKRVNSVYPNLFVARCHNYEIHCKFRYQCSNPACGRIIGRHSKSIDLVRHRCGRCHGALTLLAPMKVDGTPVTKKLNAFALFVKENYSTMKKKNSQLKHNDIMKLLSSSYKTTKEPPKTLQSIDECVDNLAQLLKF
jgi:predicted SprT family Zn-dependent metalloprotease